MGYKFKKYVSYLSLIIMNFIEQPSPEVIIEQGTLIGTVSRDGTYYEYIGIPYASYSDNGRFLPPSPPPSWKSTYKAVNENIYCVQQTFFNVTMGDTNCLAVNVYKPITNSLEPIAVMVFIHGGAFEKGSGSKIVYSPDHFMKRNVILVTFNYRLGPFGFICLGIKEAPGNAGLRDQIAALKWVKHNIKAFGGDPNSITLFGVSSGATSVSLFLLSDATDDLFNKAIIQSGSAIANWAIDMNPLKTAKILAKSLGYNSDDPSELYKIFSSLSHETLFSVQSIDLANISESQLFYKPCVEREILGIERIITDLPYNMLQRKKNFNIPIIYGSTDKEGLFLVPSKESVFQDIDKYNILTDLKISKESEKTSLIHNITEFYDIQSNRLENITHFLTHLYFEMPMIEESKIILNRIAGQVYHYHFQYSGQRNFMKYIYGYENSKGACHGDDLLYLFSGLSWLFTYSRQDTLLSDFMVEMWTNFAKYGNPTPERSKVLWQPSNKSRLNFLYIREKIEMGPIPNEKALTFWSNIYKKYRRKSI